MSALGTRGQTRVLHECFGQLAPEPLRFEQRSEQREHVAGDPEARDEGAAGGDRRGGVLGARGAHLAGAHHQRARLRRVLHILRALFQQPGVLLGIAGCLVQRGQRRERLRSRARRQQALVRRDGARCVLQLGGEIGEAFVDLSALFDVRLEARDPLEHIAQRARVFFGLQDLPEGVCRREGGVVRSVLRREDPGKRRLRTLGIPAAEQHLAELGCRLGLDRRVFNRREDATECLGRFDVTVQPRGEGDIAGAKVVVGCVEPERLLEGLERARVVAHPLLLQPA